MFKKVIKSILNSASSPRRHSSSSRRRYSSRHNHYVTSTINVVTVDLLVASLVQKAFLVANAFIIEGK